MYGLHSGGNNWLAFKTEAKHHILLIGRMPISVYNNFHIKMFDAYTVGAHHTYVCYVHKHVGVYCVYIMTHIS